MRKIIGAAFVSLDGVMQGPGGQEMARQQKMREGHW